MQTQFHTAAAAQIAATFPNLGLIPVPRAWAFLGGSPKTARNLICEARFPLPVVRVGQRNHVPAPALVDFYSAQLEKSGWIPAVLAAVVVPAGATPPTARRRGPPTLVEKAAARAAGLSVSGYRDRLERQAGGNHG